MKRIDATIYFPDSRCDTCVWVEDDATEDDIVNALQNEALSMIEFDYTEKEVK